MSKKILKKFFVMLMLLTIISNTAKSEENQTNETPEQLQKIIITPNRFSQKFQNSTGEITIITKEDIENSGAEILLDVFRTIKGIIVKDYYGNGARASVDLRGFGETASSNALVLVDGRRVNQADLSGVDWMQIPLERIERIEILHGGTGCVLYGDNAVGGVINIITKSGKTEKPKFELYTSGGSYNMNKQSLSCDGMTPKFSYSMTTSSINTNGYRENSEYESNDYGAKLKYHFTDSLSLNLSGNYHEADLGLPGPLNDTEYASFSRRDSKSTEENNNVGEQEYYLKLGLESLTFDFGVINLDFSYRRKWSDTYWGTYSTINSVRIDTFAFTPNYTCTLDLFGRPNKVIIGIDYYKIGNILNDFSTTSSQIGDSDVDKKSLGIYFNDSFAITDKLSVDLGYRFERMRYDFDYVDYQGIYTDVHDFERREEEAFKGGIVYSWNPDTQLFFNASQSFRSPLTDEFLLYDFNVFPFGRSVNKGLSTQRSLNFEWGARHAFNRYWRMDLTFFNMDVNNEIYFDPVSFINSNYEKTRHQGLDLQIDFRLTKRISAFANWIYTRARFRDGTYNNNAIPLVPMNKASLGLNLGFWKNFKVIPIINYVGKRYMISDQANQAGKLDGYITADLRLSYEKENFEIFFNAKNIFNRRYAEYAVTNATGTAKNYYPSPERNFTAGIKLIF